VSETIGRSNARAPFGHAREIVSTSESVSDWKMEPTTRVELVTCRLRMQFADYQPILFNDLAYH